jgi:hypothetical protein
VEPTKRSLIIIGAFTICVAVSGILPARQSLPSSAAAFQTMQGQSAFVGTPITSFDQLMKLVAEVKRGHLAEGRLLQKIEKGGLAFAVTEEQVRQLAAARTSHHISEAVRRWIPPPPPAPKREGFLSVLCEPVDCAISVNGKTLGNTSGGKSQLFPMPENTYAVKASAEDYQTEQPERSTTVPGNGTVMLTFRFQPTRQAFETAGRQLYERLVNGLGGGGVLKDASRFRAAGTLSLSDRDGRQSVWDLTVYYKAPDTAKFTLVRGNRAYNGLYTGREGYRWDNPPADAPSLEDVLFRICQFQIANILLQLGSPHFTLISNHAVPASDSILRVEGNPDTYIIQIDSFSHVKEIRVESSGLNSGLRALYGEYASQANPVYARLTQVLLPDKRGIEVRFADLAYHPPDLTDDIFVLKSKKKWR